MTETPMRDAEMTGTRRTGILTAFAVLVCCLLSTKQNNTSSRYKSNFRSLSRGLRSTGSPSPGHASSKCRWDKRGPSHFSSERGSTLGTNEAPVISALLGTGSSKMTGMGESLTGSRGLGLVLRRPLQPLFLSLSD